LSLGIAVRSREHPMLTVNPGFRSRGCMCRSGPFCGHICGYCRLKTSGLTLALA